MSAAWCSASPTAPRCRQAYLRMAEALGPGVSVDAMAAPGVEISVGVVRDDNFGPLVIVAAGGTLVELLADRAVACPPVTRQSAIGMLRSLRTAPLLAGWRGAPPVDIEALADVVVGFSALATELGEQLDAVEANPVIVSPDRRGGRRRTGGAAPVAHRTAIRRSRRPCARVSWITQVPVHPSGNTARSPAPISLGSPPSGVTVIRPDTT